MNGILSQFIVSACLLLACGATAGRIVIDIGSPETTELRGYGWHHRNERSGDDTFTWIRGKEADLTIILEEAQSYELEIDAYPFYYEGIRQRVAVFMNNNYVDEWVCHNDPDWIFFSYSTIIPARYVRDGENILTLRMDYQSHHGERGYALAVSRIALRPVESQDSDGGSNWHKSAIVAAVLTAAFFLIMRSRLRGTIKCEME